LRRRRQPGESGFDGLDHSLTMKRPAAGKG
jgi:hypothetical protein